MPGQALGRATVRHLSVLGISILLCAAWPAGVAAQAAAEHAAITSKAAAAASKARPPKVDAKQLKSAPDAKTQHLGAGPSEPLEVTNLRKLEQEAGEHAAKLLLRSDPNEARIWVNDLAVGTTPRILVLAPGQYRIRMSGPRSESEERKVDLLPDETRKVLFVLQPKYPTHIRLR